MLQIGSNGMLDNSDGTADGEAVSIFGRSGHQTSDFDFGHTISVDSKGNVYVAETGEGRRMQKFLPSN